MNNKGRGRPSKAQSSLGKEKIVTTAKHLMEKNGKIPSIRGLALHLEVDAMAIYHYFKNKDQMLEAIGTSLISDIYNPEVSDNWQLELLTLCKSYLTLLSDYEGLLQTLLTMQSTGPAQVFIDKFNAITATLNLTPSKQSDLLNLVVDYIHGFSLAKSCDNSQSLNIDDIEGPFNLIFEAVTHG